MGLDNGIRIKGVTSTAQHWLLEYADVEKFEMVEGGIDIAYWRKYYNVRSKIQEHIKGFKVGDDTPLTFADLVTICHICEKFITKEYSWDESRGCLWDWIHGVRNLAQIIIDIQDFIDEVEEMGFDEDEFEIYFYDSF